jgi:hypothetical protein
MNEMEMTLNIRGFDIELLVEYDFQTGGSNWYGSDEPSWCEIDIGTIKSAKRGTVISNRLRTLLLDEYPDWIYREIELEEEY